MTAQTNNQHTRIVNILKKQGKLGMNSYEYRMLFIQLPARIKELKKMGYLITTRQHPNRSVDYILIGEPTGAKPAQLRKKKAIIDSELVWVIDGNNARQMRKKEAELIGKPTQEAFF